MRRTALRSIMALALVALMLPAVAGARKFTREERRTADADRVSVVEIQNASGDNVVVGRDTRTVVVVATRVVHAGRQKNAEKRFEELQFTVAREGDRLIVRTDNKNHTVRRSFWSLLRGGHKASYIDFSVEVPANLAVEVTTASGGAQVSRVTGGAMVQSSSGEVTLRNVGGKTRVMVTSGDVVAEGIRGALRVGSSSGDVEVSGVEGDVIIHGTSADVTLRRAGANAEVLLSSGDLVVSGCLGDLRFQTSSGDASIDDVGGVVRAMTTSGDIDVAIVPVESREFRFSTSSGDVDIRYAAAIRAGFVFDVSTGSGAIEGAGPIVLEKVSRHHLTGTVGAGKSRVRVETASGDVTIADNSGAKKKRAPRRR